MEDPIMPVAVPSTASFSQPAVDEFNGTEGVYLLPHHKTEIQRLRKQHDFIKAATSGSLTPLDLPDNANILDSGCADGTWLADLAQLTAGNPKKFNLHGMDLGEALFMANPSLDLRRHDLRTDLPASWNWQNKFDLVHQRLLVWGIDSDAWAGVVSRLASTVKPGGYIQLVEAEWVLSKYTDEQPEQANLARVQEWSAAAAGFDVHVWKKLPDLLASNGFEQINEKVFDLGYGKTTKNPEDVDWTAELLPQSFRHLARNIPAEGIPGVAKDADEYMEWLDRLVVEMKAVGYTPQLRWVTGRKPLST